MSWIGYIVCGMIGLMALGFVFMLVLVLYDVIIEARAERKEKKRNGNREADRGLRDWRI